MLLRICLNTAEWQFLVVLPLFQAITNSFINEKFRIEENYFEYLIDGY